MSDVDLKNMTLVEFSDSIDQHLNREVGFADAVHTYLNAKAISDALDTKGKWAQSLDKFCLALTARGSIQVRDKRLVQRTVGAASQRRVSAKIVQQRRPDLYEACRVPTKYLYVNGTAEPVRLRPVPPLHHIGPSSTIQTVEQLIDWKRATKTQAEADRKEARERILTIADAAGWDGHAIGFSDLDRLEIDTKLRFNEAILKAKVTPQELETFKTQIKSNVGLYWDVEKVPADEVDDWAD